VLRSEGSIQEALVEIFFPDLNVFKVLGINHVCVMCPRDLDRFALITEAADWILEEPLTKSPLPRNGVTWPIFLTGVCVIPRNRWCRH